MGLILLVFFTIFAAAFGGVELYGVWHYRSLRIAMQHPMAGWGCTVAIFFGLFASVTAAQFLGHRSGWRMVCLIGINVMVQPVCGFLVVCSSYQSSGFKNRSPRPGKGSCVGLHFSDEFEFSLDVISWHNQTRSG